MAVKTKAQILAEIASLLADNTTGDISASDLRTCLNDITDSYCECLTAEGTLTSDQVNLLDTTNVSIVSAQGANTIIVVTGVTAVRKAGTAYTTAANIRLVYGTSLTTAAVAMDSTGLTGTTNYLYLNHGLSDSFDSTNFNNSLEFSASGAISGGTGGLYYKVEYMVIDVN